MGRAEMGGGLGELGGRSMPEKSAWDEFVESLPELIGWVVVALAIAGTLFLLKHEPKGLLEFPGAYEDRRQELIEDCSWLGILLAIAIGFLVSVIRKAARKTKTVDEIEITSGPANEDSAGPVTTGSCLECGHVWPKVCPECGEEFGQGVTRCLAEGCDYVLPTKCPECGGEVARERTLSD